MLQLQNKFSGSMLKAVKAYVGGVEKPVQRVFTYDTVTGEEQVYPDSPVKLRITSNYDTASDVRKEETFPYSYPVITRDSLYYTDLVLTITPYPSNAGWKLTSSNFNLGEEESKLYYGPQTLTFEVPSPATIGYLLHEIQLLPEHASSCEPVSFKFWSQLKATSELIPAHWWSFDNSDLTDKVGSNPLVKVTEEGTINYVDAVTKKGIQADYVSGATSPNLYRTTLDFNFDQGLTIAAFGKFNRGGMFGFVDQVTPDIYNGHHFAMAWNYKQPKAWLLAKNSTTMPATTSADRVDGTKWSHMCLVISPPINVLTDPRIVIDTSVNQYGTIRYTSSEVTYTQEYASSVGNDYKTWNFRLVKMFINGVNKGEFLTATEPAKTGIPAAGVFEFKMENTVEQDGAAPDVIDEIKVFTKQLSQAEIRSECVLIGLQFSDSGTTEEVIRPAKIDRDGRLRTGKPADITTIPLTCHMKGFVIDNSTIAVACNFRDFFLTRLGIEYPNLDATESNYRNGWIEEYIRRFHPLFDLWELYNDYMPLIVDAVDDIANWSIAGNTLTMIGRWQNSSGTMKFGDFLDGTSLITTDCSDMNHFAYLKLTNPMTIGSSITINFKTNSTVLNYAKNKYVSSIKVNQEGYLPNAGRKYAYFGMWLGTGGVYQHSLSDLTFYLVPTTSDTPAFTGTMTLRTTPQTHTKNGLTYLLTGENTYVCDFSSFTTEGNYHVYIPGVGYSHPFKIGANALGKAFYTHARGLFHQRSGCSDVKAPYTNWEYPRPAHMWTWESDYICDDKTYDLCVTPDGVPYGQVFSEKHFSMIPNNATGKLFRDIHGGWFDAADFDRRTYHLSCVRDLVEAYLRFPNNFTDNQLDLPESGNGIPDILSEAEWGLNVWRRGQRENGGIACWIETDSHEKGLPWLSNKKYYIGKENRKDSLDYARNAARFARALRMINTEAAIEKANLYTESAIRAYNFGINPANAAYLHFTQRSNSDSEYEFTYTEPANLADRLIAHAAATLYVLTKDPKYARDITSDRFELLYNWMTGDENEFAQICPTEFLFDLKDEFPDYHQRIKTYIIGKANTWKSYQELQTYHEMTWAPNHPFYTFVSWGVGHPERRGKAYIYAWLLTGDTSYRDAAILGLDNIMGCNAMGRCITSGLGVVNPIHFLDHWLPPHELSDGVYEPMPGITPYTFIGDASGKMTPYGYCLYKAGRADMKFTEVTKNILPAGYRNTITNTRSAVASWLLPRLPLWRSVFEMEDYIVDQSEYTIYETISGKAFLSGCLMGTGVVPEVTWKQRTPSTNRYGVEGMIYLP